MEPNNHQKLEKIEAFLRGEMSEGEQEAFQIQLEEDESLRELYLQHKDVQEYFNQREALQNFRHQVKKVNFKPSRRRVPFWSLAASLLLFISAGIYFLMREPSIDKLYNQNFEIPGYFLNPNSSSERGEDDEIIVNQLQLVKEYVAKGEYDKAIEEFKGIDPEFVFHKGILFMILEDWNEAIQAFDLSVESRPEASAWYQGLCFLKLKEFDQVKLLHQPFTEYANPYREKAEKILRKIGE